MQNPVLKFRQNFFISEKPGYLSEKLKTLTSSNHHRVLIFFAEILDTFPSCQCLKEGVWDFFLFCLDLEFLINLVFVSV